MAPAKSRKSSAGPSTASLSDIGPGRSRLLAYRLGSGAWPVFDGGGAMVMAGRWSTPPRRVVNCASTYALAILESVVHWNRRRLPPTTRHVVIEIHDDVSRQTVDPDSHPGWNADDYSVSQSIGNRWYDSGNSLIMIAPSVLSPYEGNILINQNHPEIHRLIVSAEHKTVLDRRLVAG